MADLTRHPDVVDLAEYAEGLLDPDRHSAVDHHVRDCLDCTRVLSDLDELPAALAQAPMPPMPSDVAARLDRAIAAESTARASLWSGAAKAGAAKAEVTPLRPRRRWIAPVVAAAAVLGVIGIAVPALDDSGGTDDSATSAESDGSQDLDRGSEDPDAAPDQGYAGEMPTVALSSDHFGRDVVDAFYHSSGALRLDQPLVEGTDGKFLTYRDRVDSIPDVCSSDDPSTVPNGQVDEVTYDGEAALLLRVEVGDTVEAIAYRCDGDQADILDAVTLRPAG